jgi:hypothetical protein
VKWPPAWEVLVENEFYTGGCEDRTREREAEEFLLEAVARELLIKTQQTGKRLSG